MREAKCVDQAPSRRTSAHPRVAPGQKAKRKAARPIARRAGPCVGRIQRRRTFAHRRLALSRKRRSGSIWSGRWQLQVRRARAKQRSGPLCCCGGSSRPEEPERSRREHLSSPQAPSLRRWASPAPQRQPTHAEQGRCSEGRAAPGRCSRGRSLDGHGQATGAEAERAQRGPSQRDGLRLRRPAASARQRGRWRAVRRRARCGSCTASRHRCRRPPARAHPARPGTVQ